MPLKLSRFCGRAVCAALVLVTILVLSPAGARAVSIELRDEAPDRIERQRTAAIGKIPLAGTPDTAQFAARLTAQGLKTGLPMLIRIFKAQSELEVWMEKDGTYVLFATYPICHWSGTLGPKTREGDKQTPEGFYTITSRQLHRLGRWTRALNLGFPNAFDESLKRDGSYILVHGGCSSVGCFAMTNPVIEEIYVLTSAALRAGQRHVPVHVFPFRMTAANLERQKTSEWLDFWMNLKQGYDAFERTRRPPYVSVCDGRYRIEEINASPLEAGAPGPLAVCGPTAAALLDSDKSAWLVPLAPRASPLQPSASWALRTLQGTESWSGARPQLQSFPQLLSPLDPWRRQRAINTSLPLRPQLVRFQSQPGQWQPVQALSPAQATAAGPSTADPPLEIENRKAVASVDPALAYELVPRLVAPAPRPGIQAQTLPCNLSLASCRRYAALLTARPRSKSKVAAAQSRLRTASRLR